jgi:hypothetical protein
VDVSGYAPRGGRIAGGRFTLDDLRTFKPYVWQGDPKESLANDRRAKSDTVHYARRDEQEGGDDRG